MPAAGDSVPSACKIVPSSKTKSVARSPLDEFTRCHTLVERRNSMFSEPGIQGEAETASEPGTRWLEPQGIAVEILHPSLLAALEQRNDVADFQGYLARVYEMPGDTQNGFFHIAVNPTTSEAAGLHTVSLVMGEKYAEDIELAIGPIWLDARDATEAAAELYAVLKDVGRLA
ncbi:hypothetical protein [Ensifer sp. 4252]|uniref:hypothetical protein n=1 Tax=Ensifer sp. 4252 TaxID=3373915 RepID=UPI003D21DDFD